MEENLNKTGRQPKKNGRRPTKNGRQPKKNGRQTKQNGRQPKIKMEDDLKKRKTPWRTQEFDHFPGG
jgi:hypothetical protein